MSLTIVLSLLAAGFSLLTYFLTPLYSMAWAYVFLLIPFYILYYVNLFGLFLLALTAYGALLPKKKVYQPNKRTSFFFHQVCFQFLLFSNVKVFVSGIEKLPKQKALYVFNHSSSYDTIVYFAINEFANHIMYSKEENQKQFFIGPLIRRAGFLSISRDDPIKAAKAIYDGSKLLEKGVCSIAVSPEGTRSKSRSLLPFHAGVFKAATLAKAPIVVLSFQNCGDVHPRFPKRTNIYLDVVEVLYEDQYKDLDAEALSDNVKKSLEEHLHEKSKRLYSQGVEE